MTEESVVDRETAEQEFEKFVKCMRVNMKVRLLDENERAPIMADRERIILGVEEGRMIVDDNGIVTVEVQDGLKPVSFKKPKGDMLLAMDRRKEGHTMGKMLASMAACAQVPAERFSRMDAEDVYDCMAVWNFFTP